MINSVEKLKRASSAVYFLDGAKEPADDCSSLLRWAVAEIEKLQAAINQAMCGGNHLATYRTARWPDYKLDGLTRAEQCEHALRTLGASREYDIWCCWSAIMQARDSLALAETESGK